MGLCKDAECHVDCSFECYTHETNILSTCTILRISVLLDCECSEFPSNTHRGTRGAVEYYSLLLKLGCGNRRVLIFQKQVMSSSCPYIKRK